MSIKDGILDLTIQKYWFNEIKTKRKTHEYRNIKSWKNKLSKPENYKTIRFRLGQTTKATDSTKVLYGKILSITEKNGKDTDLKTDVLVYDIEFKLIKSKNNDK